MSGQIIPRARPAAYEIQDHAALRVDPGPAVAP
jgi:hypothetical protein